jgi:hypothetical protein
LQSVELSVTTKTKQPISHLVDFFSLYRIIPQAEIIINYSLRTNQLGYDFLFFA